MKIIKSNKDCEEVNNIKQEIHCIIINYSLLKELKWLALILTLVTKDIEKKTIIWTLRDLYFYPKRLN